MGYFDYPLDAKMLLRKKKLIKEDLLQQNVNWIEKRIAILGGSTTDEVTDQLELALLSYGIKAEFYQSEYGKYWEDAMFGNAVLDKFFPDIIYIHTSWRNIQVFPDSMTSMEEAQKMNAREFGRYVSMWESLKRFECPVIQNNFDRPNYRLLGNRDIWDHRGRSNFVFCLNQKMYEYASGQDTFFINDLDYIAQDFGLSEWNASVYWDMYKYACCLNAIPYLAGSVAHIIKSIFGKNKKLLALDLDNTLWGGVIGDDGTEGIHIGLEDPQGQAYYEFQHYCKELKQIGVILAVDSKNEQENALAGINHPSGALRQEDFVTVKANWQTKDQNLREIAEELSIGFDSFVFVDDNPAEREIVNRQLPEVAVPAIEHVEDYIRILDHSGYFEVTAFSEEDFRKTEQYRAKASAEAMQAAYADYGEYLADLHMRAVITGFEPINFGRVAQLTNKSNQFNLTTLRCSEDDIRVMQASPDYICLCGRLVDKFADNGIVTVVAGEIKDNAAHIRLWLMSCRVLERGLEYVMMNTLVSRVADRGLEFIYGYYYPTKKNGKVKDFYKNMGFSLVTEDVSVFVWKLRISEYVQKKAYMDVSELI